MDYTQVLQPPFNALWYLIPLAILAAVIKSPWFKGKAGEAAVNLSAKLVLDKIRYHLIKNVTLPTEDGTTQIDHIIVSRYGVFVVETRNMRGWIFGGEKQCYWTQKIYKHSQKFQSPLYQNCKHLKTLKNLMSLGDEQVYSLVVFVGDSTFKTPIPKNVTFGRGFIRLIEAQTEKRLSDSEVQRVVETIESGWLATKFKNHRKHIVHVKETVTTKDSEPRGRYWGEGLARESSSGCRGMLSSRAAI